MKFKRNFLLTFILNYCCILIIGINPILIIMFSIFKVDDVPIFLPFIIIILSIILGIMFSIFNILTWPFSKKNIYIDKNNINYNNETISFAEVDYVYFELGSFSRTSMSPCCLSLYEKNICKMSITHISFIALVVILFKLRHKQKRIFPKSLFITGICLYLVSFLISLICYINI